MDRIRSRFTANIHHELRTPLTLMLSPLEAMLGGEFGAVSEMQRGYLRTMHSNALRLLKLINNLLDLAKIESKQLKVTRRPVRLRGLVEGLVEGARPLAERKGVVLATRGLEALPVVCVDREALEKVVVNLLGNALKFTERGGRIEISARPVEASETGIHLVVSDSGLGIPPEQLERIFDRFAQLDGSSTRRHEGTGIGLSLVKELVELHGGRVWAESEGLGRGTQMHLVLPLGEADSEAEEDVLAGEDGAAIALGNSLRAMEGELGSRGEDTGELEEELPAAARGSDGAQALRAPEASQPAGTAGAAGATLVELERSVERSEGMAQPFESSPSQPHLPAGTPEVLVVEDNRDMRRLLTFLVGQEFRVRVARNGREGLERVREKAPDLVLTDVMMPEMSGTELCAALKGDPQTRSIPLVLVTSKAEREMKVEGLELGADDYVTKPFHPRELMARVRSLVRLHRLQEELAVRNALLQSTNAELEATLGELREAGVKLVQAERLAAVGELAAGVAHEVNNPMNFATNALKTLRAYVADVQAVATQIAAVDWSQPEAREAKVQELEKLKQRLEFDETVEALGELVTIAAEGLDRTQRLVGDLRDFATPGGSGRGEVDVLRALDSTLQLVRHHMRESGLELQVEIPTTPVRITGDARALNQVFLNLLKNAAEALKGRRGTIRVAARREGDAILVEIADNGPGVPPELQERIFEPFFSTKEAGRGTGLGLAISRRIAEEHGGSLSVRSVPDEGSVFSVRLPVAGGGDAA